MTPEVVIRPMPLKDSVNHNAPSGSAVISDGLKSEGEKYSVTDRSGHADARVEQTITAALSFAIAWRFASGKPNASFNDR
jgi:hypothetical protein